MSKLGIMDILNSHFVNRALTRNGVMLLYVNIYYSIEFAILKREIDNFWEKVNKVLR